MATARAVGSTAVTPPPKLAAPAPTISHSPPQVSKSVLGRKAKGGPRKDPVREPVVAQMPKKESHPHYEREQEKPPVHAVPSSSGPWVVEDREVSPKVERFCKFARPSITVFIRTI